MNTHFTKTVHYGLNPRRDGRKYVPLSLGRNGVLNTHGINIRELENYIELTPILKNGKPGTGWVAVTKNKAVLLQLADALHEMAQRLPDLTLKEFTEKTNALDKAYCDDLNRKDPNAPFPALHIPLSEAQLEFYWKHGYTPEGALNNIESQCEDDGRAEAAAS